MKLYAELPLYRTRQIFLDALFVAWTVLWIAVGRSITRLVGNLAEPARLLEDSGSDLAGAASNAGGRVVGVPLVGQYLQSPFQSLERVGHSLADAGQAQQETVATLALWLGVAVAAIAILVVAVPWAIRRWLWIREASALVRLRGDSPSLHLLALRAISRRPLPELLAACPDPAAAYSSGDYAPLAALELSRMGLRSMWRRGLVA